MNDNDTLADDLRKDSLALMKLLADEKHKSEALAAEMAVHEAEYNAHCACQFDADTHEPTVTCARHAEQDRRIRALEAELTDSQAKQRALVTEVAMWKENHREAVTFNDQLTQDGIKERDRIRALEAELADSRQWMAEMRATGAQHADRISALEADLADQVRVTEEHQRLRYQCETENTRLAAELAVAHTQCGHNQLTINALGERLGKKQDAQGELTQCDGPDSYE